MAFRDIFRITQGTKIVLAVCASVAVVTIAVAAIYYRSLNIGADPLLKKSGGYLLVYEKESSGGRYSSAMNYLDSAMAVLRKLPYHETSFETGVIHNNRAGILIIQAIYVSPQDTVRKMSLLLEAMKQCDSAITAYNRWISLWNSLGEEEITRRVSELYGMKDIFPEVSDKEKFIKRKVKYILEAKIETPRRLSVALTNKATVYRHLLQPDSALACLKRALLIWDDNRTAKSNLSVLLGGDPVRPGILQTLFPPERFKKGKFEQ